MLDQNKKNRNFIRFSPLNNQTSIQLPNHSNHARPLEGRKLMIVKSYSLNHTIKPFFPKQKHSSSHRYSTPNNEPIPQPQGLLNNKEITTCSPPNHHLSECSKQLRKFRDLQKESLFNKISNIQTKFNKQRPSCKNRQNRNYIIKPKIKNIEVKRNCKKIDISSLLTIKHIDKASMNLSKSTIYSHKTYYKFSVLQRKSSRYNQHKSICLSKSGHLSKEQPLNDSFSAWNTREDYDF